MRARAADEQNKNWAARYSIKRGAIRYVMTTSGPEPLEARTAPLDYDHYLTKQLQPVADGILPFVQDDFATLITGQLGLLTGDERVTFQYHSALPEFTAHGP